MKINKKIAFTMAEMLMTIGILGTLIAVLFPSLQSAQPNQNKILLRKGYQVVERVVNNLINDDTLYPSENGFAAKTSLVFCQNFQDTLNLSTTKSCAVGSATKIGTTPDGIDWYFYASSSNPTGSEPYIYIIMFDVNGEDKSPNCSTTSTSNPSGYTACSGGKKPDLFKVGVRADGKMHLGGKSTDSDSYAINVLSSVTNNMNDK